ncbi:GAF domain-containing protein [Pyxidicoccus sp. QH1ED-7-1]|nr:GAF domain-containing protein [Pyxidicoccus xibeiensis]
MTFIEGAGEESSREEATVRTERERLLHRQSVLLEQSALLELAAAQAPDFQAGLRRILKSDAELLGVSRVSYWSLDLEARALECDLLYVRERDAFERGARLLERDFPSYFHALLNELYIAADDARRDARTREFTTSYLEPQGITSMLDVPVWVRGRLGGVVCHEQVGRPHAWTAEELAFSRSIGHVLSMALETAGRRRAEAFLEQSEERFRLLADGVKDQALVMLDPEGRVVSWNAGARRILGYDTGEALGRHVSAFLPPEGVEHDLVQARLRVAEARGQVELEEWRQRKDGSRFWARIVLTSLRDAEGRLSGFAEVSRDMTERKVAELQRRLLAEASLAEQRQRLLAEVSAVLVSSLDSEAALTAVARRVVPQLADTALLHLQEDGTPRRVACAHAPGSAAARLHGDAAEEGDGMGPPAELVRVLRTGRPRLIPDTQKLLRRLGTRGACRFPLLELFRPASALVVPLIARGRTLGTLTLLREQPGHPYTGEDLSLAEELARRSAYAVDNARLYVELRRAEQSQRFLGEAARVLVESLDYETTLGQVARLGVPLLAEWCVVDIVEEGNVLRRVAAAHANPEKEPLLRELQRRYPARWDSNPPATRVLRTGRPELFAELTDALLLPTVEDARHARLIRELGTKTALSVPLVARGRILGALTFGSAVPGRRYGETDLLLAQELAHRTALAIDNARLYQQAQQAVSLRDEFLSIASHELRTPITTLHLQLQHLQRLCSKTQEPALCQKLEASTKQIHRLDKLIDGLLDVSRISLGQMRFDLETLDLSQLAREVLEQFQQDAGNARCELVLRAPAPVTGRFDRLRLEQVLANLLSNAIKYAAGKPVVVEVEDRGDFARLSVVDQGIGISEQDLGRIFGRFERAVSSHHYGGLGLGLFITRQIVEAHGGSIEVTSRPGAGSTFTVFLPRRFLAGAEDSGDAAAAR